MSMRDVQFVNLSPNEMALALGRGDVDAACVWQPLLDNLKKAAPDESFLGTDADTETYKRFGTMSSPDILIISRKLVEEHPDQARRLAVCDPARCGLCQRNPEAAAAAVAHLFRQPPDVVLAGIRNFKYYGSKGWREHMNKHTEQMQFLSLWLHRNKKIERRSGRQAMGEHIVCPRIVTMWPLRVSGAAFPAVQSSAEGRLHGVGALV